MKVEIKVPTMGESIVEATVGEFLKENGAQVVADEELIELETDKVNQVLYAPKAGVVSWDVKKDDVVKVGQIIGFIDTEKTAGVAVLPSAEDQKKALSTQKQEEQKREEPKEAFISSSEPKLDYPQHASGKMRTSKEDFVNGLNAGVDDVETASSKEQVQDISSKSKPETRKKMSKIRKVIAGRLVDVLRNTAMLTTFNEVDMTNINALRDSYKEIFTKKYNARLGFMPFFVKASVSAMKAFPEINAYIDGEEIVYREYFDIGIAIGTDRGLIVPVVRNCDTLSFADIELSIENYAKKAREGGLIPDDLQGGGFTITNGGTYGSLLSTPILNPPQSAILGMHKIMKRAVVVDDHIVIRPMMYLALSYDHRVVDGKEAVSFLVHIKNCLEDPSRILIGV